MEQALTAALAQVKTVFAVRPKPLNVNYCLCPSCFTEADMNRLFAIPYGELTYDDLNRILWKSFTTWGDWPDLAYYVPRLLGLYADPAVRFTDDDMLLHKLMIAAHPELCWGLGGKPETDFVKEPMSPSERQTVFEFFKTVLEVGLNTSPYGELDVPELVALLAVCDVPLAPTLNSWQQSASPLARGNLCLFMADYVLHHSTRRPLLTNTYLDKVVFLPENQAALDALLAPANIAAYLLEYATDADLLGPDWETGIGAAFDWAMQAPA